MQEFIDLKQETEFWFAFICTMGVFGWAGYQIGEFQKSKGNFIDAAKNINYNRAKLIIKMILK